MPTKQFLNYILLVIFFGLALPVTGTWISVTYFTEARFIFEPLHAVVEGLGGFIAITLSGILLVSMDRLKGREMYVWISCALLSMGVLDIFHAAVPVGNLFVWLHCTAQFFGGFFFLFVWAPERISNIALASGLPWMVLMGALIFGSLSILFPETVPFMTHQGQFTLLAQALNIVGGIGFFIATVFFMGRFKTSRSPDDLLYAIHTALFGSAGVLFETSVLWDAAWWWWHVLRIFAYTAALTLAISSYRKTEQFLREFNEQLEIKVQTRTQELEQFASIVSHDLKAPLRAVNNLSQWIEEDLGDDLDEEVSKNMTALRGRVKRMENLIDGILEYSRAGHFEPRLNKCNLNEILNEVIESIEIPDGFKVEVEPDMPEILADPTQLHQVLSNLISNGIKHHNKSHGSLKVTARESKQDREFVELFVTDDGPGIPPEYSEKVFEVFQTLDARDEKENTGIGLAIVKKIIEGHKGTIDLLNTNSIGTTFHILWPKGTA